MTDNLSSLADADPHPSSLPYPHAQSPSTVGNSAQAESVVSPSSMSQSAFAHNAQLSGLDKSLLDGISPEQLSYIARLLQSGQLRVPDAPPLASQITNSNSAEMQNNSKALKDATRLVQEDVNMDKEEGELEEGEVGEAMDTSLSPDHDVPRLPPTGPRQLSTYPHTRPSRPYDGHASSSHVPVSESSAQKPSYDTNDKTDRSSLVRIRGIRRTIVAKAFVLQLYNAGYSFDDIARNVSDPQPLRRMFQELGLSTFNISSQHPQQNQRSPSAATGAPTAMTGEPRKRPVPAPAKAGPAARSEYLAKLAAAKNKSSATNGSKPSTKISASAKSPIAVNKSLSAPTAVDKTELARQKLEALLAKQAAKQNGSRAAAVRETVAGATSLLAQSHSNATPQFANDGKLSKSSQSSANVPLQSATDSIQSPVTQASRQSQSSPIASGNSGAFGKLPGLFMASTPLQKSPMSGPPPQSEVQADLSSRDHLEASPAVPLPLATIPRKRAVASDFDGPQDLSSAFPSKRPFGQSRRSSFNEQIIINVSDDDDDDGDDDMDIDERASDSIKAPGTVSARPSIVATGGSSTTATSSQTYEQVQAQIEQYKQRIAERQQARLMAKGSQKASTPQDTSSPTSGVVTPTVASDGKPKSPTVDVKASTPIAFPATEDDAGINPRVPHVSVTKAQLQHRLLELNALLGRATPKFSDDSTSIDLHPTTDATTTRQADLGPMLRDVAENSSIGPRYEPGSISQVTAAINDGGPTSPEIGLDSVSANSDTNSDEYSHSDSYSADGAVQAVQQQNRVEGTNIPTGGIAVPPHVHEDDRHNTDDSHWTDDEMDESQTESSSLASGSSNDEIDHTDVQKPNVPNQPDPNVTSGGAQPDDAEVPETSSASDSHSSNYEPELVGSLQENINGELPDDDKALQVHNEQAETLTNEDQGTNPKTRFFTPYHSPLARFNDYKYHPEFTHNVNGGYQSLTYSHKIDSDNMLCPYEGAGGQCNDRMCPYQHFSSMGITDNDLLTLLVSHRPPTHNVEEEKRWKEGLGQMIKELRLTNMGKDVSTIAARIAQFRRDFLGDSSKVLNLD